MGQPTLFKNLRAGVNTTSTSLTTIFTHSSSLKNPDGTAGNGGVLDRLQIFNGDSVNHIVELFLVGAGLSAGTSNLIERVSVGALGAPSIFDGPLYGSSGDFYQVRLAEASTSTPVSLIAHYHEMS